MEIVKWVLLFIVIGLAVYLIIDTTLFAVKKIKEKKKKQLEQQNKVNNDDEKAS